MENRRTLDPAKVIDTLAALHRRISERFPDSGLARVCSELHTIAKQNSARAERISRSNLPLRLIIFVLLAGGAVGLAWIAYFIYLFPRSADNVYSVLQGLEAAANLAVLLGAATFFLFRIEQNLKRRDALQALHELRSIVHVIDMHQLTKDPSVTITVGGKTPSSPQRVLSPFEVSRYLDYCSEMVSLTSKVAVLFAQGFPDAVVTEVVSDIERVAAGLSQKIWQKIMILQSSAVLMSGATAARPATPSAA
jgi:type VI protein secretion system component VasF